MKIISSILLFLLCVSAIVAQNGIQSKNKKTTVDPIFKIEEILDESTLDIMTLQDWHVDKETGTTRQKLIEINVAAWWPGQDYRIPVRMIVPLKSEAKGFHITGGNTAEILMKDSRPNDFQAKLLSNGVGIVKTVVKEPAQIPGKQGLKKEMGIKFLEDLNPRYTTVWIWSMTLMRATTAAYTEVDHFEKGKVAGSGGSKNGISPAVALINDERFTATCSSVAFAYYSPTRGINKEEIDKVKVANKAFFEATMAGDIALRKQRVKWYQAHMIGGKRGMAESAQKAGKSQEELQQFADGFWSSLCVTENWEQLIERDVDVLFQPGTHDWVAYDVLWGAQNHPQLPVYYKPNGGHEQKPHGAAFKDNQNTEAFLWNHFFGGEPMLKPPKSSHKVDKDKLTVSVRFDEGPQPKSGRIWWIYDRAPAGSAPFLHVQIPEDQWMDMEFDAKTGAWTATIPLKDGFSLIDFFSNHGLEVNGYKQYLSSPYTRVEGLNPALNRILEEINDRFEHVDVELVEWPDELQKKLGKLKKIAFLALPVKKPTGKLPLLISLHGAGGRKMSLEQQLARSAEVKGLGLAELAGKDLILLEPNTAGIWDVSSLNTMLDYVLEHYQEIDANRVYVMGHSMGGWGTWAWINESSDRFAAAAPCGFSAGDTGDVEHLVNLPIWGMVGGDDKKDRTTGIKKMVERLRAAGNKHVKHTEFPGANHAEGNAAVFSSVELVDWMLGFSRGK